VARVDPQRPTPEVLIWAYGRGIFPMADPATGRIDYYSPDPRAILPLDAFEIPKSLARRARSGRFEISSDRCFERVMRECAQPRPGHPGTWIDERLVEAYVALHELGCAHSVEAWRDGDLVGGLYGVSLGGAFFGESMFSRPEHGGTDASKVCLVHLVEHLRAGGFALLDTQFQTPHLRRFGVVEVRRSRYLSLLERALALPGRWQAEG
jgi:leucyl/phenylalanyl-tRNA--protein transferase